MSDLNNMLEGTKILSLTDANGRAHEFISETEQEKAGFKLKYYMWLSRLFILFAIVSLLVFMSTSLAIFKLAPQVSVEPFLIIRQDTSDGIVRYEPISYKMASKNQLMETFVRQYVLLRNTITNRIRIIVQLVVVAALVTIVSEILKAFAYDVSVQLSVYVGLIITNCILMGRLEAFAMQNGPWESFLDGVGNGLGYAKILVIVAFFRELLGSGTLLGFNILNYEPIQNIGYVNNGLMLMPPMALIIVACIIWYQRARHKELQEESN